MEEDRSVDGIGESLRYILFCALILVCQLKCIPHRQIGCADVLLLNKVDLAPPSRVSSTSALVHSINPAAPIFQTVRCKIDLKHVMGLNAYTSGPAMGRVYPPESEKGVSSHTHGDHATHS